MILEEEQKKAELLEKSKPPPTPLPEDENDDETENGRLAFNLFNYLFLIN